LLLSPYSVVDYVTFGADRPFYFVLLRSIDRDDRGQQSMCLKISDAAAVMTNAETGTVRCLRTQLFDELPAFEHAVACLRLVRFGGEKVWDHLIPQFRHGRCQDVVSGQLFSSRRYLYWLEESSESDQRAFHDLYD
jgi:hypothetical protein